MRDLASEKKENQKVLTWVWQFLVSWEQWIMAFAM